jgi:CRP/FNR family transcriptional regulator
MTEAPRALYVVLAGQVKLYKSSAVGKEQTLNLLGPGDPFGMCTAFADDAFPATPWPSRRARSCPFRVRPWRRWRSRNAAAA